MRPESRFRTTKPYDVIVALPLIALYALGIVVRLAPDTVADIRQLPSPMACLHVLRDLANLGYVTLIVAIILLRRMPVAKSDFLPRAVALTSGYLYLARIPLPHANLSPAIDTVATVLTTIGTAAAIAVLFWLRRAFSILPEARTLVTAGPYRIVRHPLYATEEIANIGAMLQFAQPWSLLIEIVNVALQLWRISFEERVLLRAFPDYAAYASRTRRLIPGVY
jgi:protein-S-isoprenylcysteine O-methyltransferase Ste14